MLTLPPSPPPKTSAPQETTTSSDAPLRAGAAAGGAGSSPSTPGEPPILTPVEYRDKYHLHVHRLPPHPGLKDYLLFLPLAVYKFVDRLCDAFGFKASCPYVWMDVRACFRTRSPRVCFEKGERDGLRYAADGCIASHC